MNGGRIRGIRPSSVLGLLSLTACASLAERPPLEPIPFHAVPTEEATELPGASAAPPLELPEMEVTQTAEGLRVARVTVPFAMTTISLLSFPPLDDVGLAAAEPLASRLAHDYLREVAGPFDRLTWRGQGSARGLRVESMDPDSSKGVQRLAKAVCGAEKALEDYVKARRDALQSFVSADGYDDISINLARIGRYGSEHPWAQGTATRVTYMAGISREKMLELWPRLFDLSSAVLVVIGRDPPAAEAIAEQFCALAPPEPVEAKEPLEVPAFREEGGHRFHAMWYRGDQVEMRALHTGPGTRSPDYLAFSVISDLLDDGFGSEADRALRHDSGASYGFHGRFYRRQSSSEILWGGSVAPRFGYRTFELHRDQIRSLVEEEITPERLKAILVRRHGRYLRRLDDTAWMASALAECMLLDIPVGAECLLPDESALTPTELRATAERWLHPEQLDWALVGTSAHVFNRLQFEGTIYRYEKERAE